MALIKQISQETFTEYGKILDFSEGSTETFEIVVREENHPWRLAVYRPNLSVCTFLEQHVDSMESFEPQKGVSVLVVAKPESPEKFEIFLLDRPVCLYKGIWHNVIALSSQVWMRVTENNEVSCDFFELDRPIKIGAVYDE